MGVLDSLTSIFGGWSKYVLIGIIGLGAILGVVLVIFLAVNIKWVALGGGIALVLAIIGIIVYKKVIKKDATA